MTYFAATQTSRRTRLAAGVVMIAAALGISMAVTAPSAQACCTLTLPVLDLGTVDTSINQWSPPKYYTMRLTQGYGRILSIDYANPSDPETGAWGGTYFMYFTYSGTCQVGKAMSTSPGCSAVISGNANGNRLWATKITYHMENGATVVLPVQVHGVYCVHDPDTGQAVYCY